MEVIDREGVEKVGILIFVGSGFGFGEFVNVIRFFGIFSF